MKKQEKKNIEKKVPQIAEQTNKCSDPKGHIHGKLKTRGKIFEGIVLTKSQKRISIVFERMVYVKKYERYTKSRTKIHARLPDCIKDQIKVGDYIKVQECRPLSKIIHFVVIKKIKDGEKEK